MHRGQKARSGPLRKVMSDFWREVDCEVYKVRVHFEKLECGHEQRIPKDIYGEFSSYRRRCGQCKALTMPTEK